MRKHNHLHNDVSQCVAQARELVHTHRQDRRLRRAFDALAGDERVGLLAYAIWRGRARLLSRLRMTALTRYDGEAAGASHAHS